MSSSELVSEQMVLGLFFSFLSPFLLPFLSSYYPLSCELRTWEFRFNVTDSQASPCNGQRCGLYAQREAVPPPLPLPGLAAFLPVWGAFSPTKN